MELGSFTMSLTVKDIHASKKFYETLGFTEVGGNIDQKWLVLRNGEYKLGIFQGMFEKNMLTFNPGWSQNREELESFTDVREIQKQLRAKGIAFVTEADETTTGPAHFIVNDPDGNPILVDQHR
jgi:catechol 2,3-dioxygenase-like lactoylglutathione lyase family enzyme